MVTSSDVPHVPLGVKITCRSPATSSGPYPAKDSLTVNGVLEPSAEGGRVFVKRAGLIKEAASIPEGTGQGLFTFKGFLYAICGDQIYDVFVPTNPVTSFTGGVFVPGMEFDVLSDAPYGTTILKSVTGMWVVTGNPGALVVTNVSDPDYPSQTAPGVAYLDGSYYVMTVNGEVHGSDLNNPLSWNPLNFIAPDAVMGLGAGIVRHLNYIVALYENGTQFYYDAGNSPGSPLGAVQSSMWLTGCSSGNSVVEFWDTTFFIGSIEGRGRQIVSYSGLSRNVVSTPYIDKILDEAYLKEDQITPIVYSCGMSVGGHALYVLYLLLSNITLVYDIFAQEWYIWSTSINSGEHPFTLGFAAHANKGAGFSQTHYMQDATSGQVYQFSPDVYQDDGNPISCLIRTSPHDWGTLKQKFYAATFLHGDTVSTTVDIRYTDDDYQTFSAWRTVDMSTARKMLQRCGRSRRRAWEVRHTGNSPLRLEQLQFDMKVGPA